MAYYVELRKEESILEEKRNETNDLCRTGGFADVNDLITYMPPFRGFTMIRRVDVGTDLKRTLFRLLHPLRFHVHYDLPELYQKLTEKPEETPEEE